MIRELDMVALTRDFEAYGLKQGDIGAVCINTAERALRWSS